MAEELLEVVVDSRGDGDVQGAPQLGAYRAEGDGETVEEGRAGSGGGAGPGGDGVGDRVLRTQDRRLAGRLESQP
ncbi:hypothetical protein, partial [Streptomyces sp. NPDC018347]|uniref:hypothetical protein n=1 Tax=Streptomyces sp. NPDC018347 TaxID=3157193 RepID=UPI0033ED96F4